MKKNLISLLRRSYLPIMIFLCSCANITEEIYLNADGSGKYLVYTDVISSSRSMMMEMVGGIYPDLTEDSLSRYVDEQIWSEFPSEVDSIIDLTADVPDSVKNDPEQMKYLSRMEMFMKGSKTKGYLNSGTRFDFKDVQELQEFQEFLNKNQSSNNMGMDVPEMKVKYSFDGKTFSRTTLLDGAFDMNDSTMTMLNSLLEGSTSRLIIHLPRKAKKVSKNRLVGKDGKDVTYEFDLLKVMKGEQSSDVEVEF